MSNDTEATTKVVINACYGGFSLSDEACREYLRRTARDWSERPNDQGFKLLGQVFTVDGKDYWSERDIPRTDPVLIALVEEMGDDANGSHASLKIEEVPKGTAYIIDEYDGYESIQTRDEIGWSIA